MIYKRYGTAYQSVEADFDSKALNEISFRRDRQDSIAVDEFEREWEQVALHELEAQVDGSVHDETEQKLLDGILADLDRVVAEAGDGAIVVIESEQGKDWPKTRQVQKNVIVEGENRLHFYIRVEPPLRVGVYRRRS